MPPRGANGTLIPANASHVPPRPTKKQATQHASVVGPPEPTHRGTTHNPAHVRKTIVNIPQRVRRRSILAAIPRVVWLVPLKTTHLPAHINTAQKPVKQPIREPWGPAHQTPHPSAQHVAPTQQQTTTVWGAHVIQAITSTEKQTPTQTTTT